MRTKHHVGFVLVVAMVGGPSPVREFVDAIPVGTSPGLAADLLIRVARAPAAAAEGRAWQQALYEKAIELSSAIDEPFPTVPLPGTHTDTRDGVASSGASLGVDALSVRVRATQGLLSLAPSAALDVARQRRSSAGTRLCPMSRRCLNWRNRSPPNLPRVVVAVDRMTRRSKYSRAWYSRLIHRSRSVRRCALCNARR